MQSTYGVSLSRSVNAVGETKIVLTCRQLLHSTQLYAECLSSVDQVWKDQVKISASPKLRQSLLNIGRLVENDLALLRTIKADVDEIFKSSSSKTFFHNMLISSWSGRIDKIHKLEAELMNRFQIITAVMMKEVYQVD